MSTLHSVRSLACCYICCTISYGFVRAVTYDWSSTRRYHQASTRTYETKEKLLADKIGSVVSQTCVACWVWPWMLSMDLMRLECYVREKSIMDYGE